MLVNLTASARRTGRCAISQSGLTLVELMIAITIGVLVIAALSATFVNSSRTRDEAERANQLIENGRYAMQVLGDDLRLAGYVAELNIAQAAITLPTAKPDPCDSSLTGLVNAMPLYIQGYDNGATLACITEPVVPNTDIIVVRRVGTCVLGPTAGANCTTPAAGYTYFQASLCNNSGPPPAELAAASSAWYLLDTNSANFTNAALGKHKKDCATFANYRQYITRIYFVAQNDTPGDGIPTLKRVELTQAGLAGTQSWSVVPIAEGIENLQLEYGIDADNNGVPDAMNANPDAYAPVPPAANSCPSGPLGTPNVWCNVMAVKINLISRNTTPTSGYTDTKTYTLGLRADGTANTFGPFNDQYKRHAFQAEVRISNPAGRR